MDINVNNAVTVAATVVGVALLAVAASLAPVKCGPAPIMAAQVTSTEAFYIPPYVKALNTPCLTPASDNCYWDAPTRGDGQGVSYVVVSHSYYYLDGVPTGK